MTVRLQFILWLSLVIVLFTRLERYHLTAGHMEDPPVMVPTAKGSGWRLFVGIHPKCPCTMATIAELERLMRHLGDKVHCEVWVCVPADDARIPETAIVERARKVTGVHLGIDVDGRRAAGVGIHTSGGVLLLDSQGFTRFHGGITRGRGHEGDNLGAAAIRSIVAGGDAVVKSLVYGCQIRKIDRNGNSDD